MTTPTRNSSSPGPNTVIGDRPAGFEPVHHLERAVHGHGQLVAEIANHLETDRARREIARQEADRAAVQRGTLDLPCEG